MVLPMAGLLVLAGCVAPDYDYVRPGYYVPDGGYYDSYYDDGYYGGCVDCGSVSIGIGYGYPGYGYDGYGYGYPYRGYHDYRGYGYHGRGGRGGRDRDDHWHHPDRHGHRAPDRYRRHTSSGQQGEPARL